MASLTPSDSWDDVYQLETTDPVQGGVGGISNTPHQNNTNRTERIKETLNLVGIDVENKLINKNRIEYVDSLSELQALTGMAEDDVVHISGRTTINDGGQGNFIWRVGDYSAQVTADTLSGIYAPSDADPTGAAGCWVRQYSGAISSGFFGASETASSTVNTGAFQAWANFLTYLPNIKVGRIDPGTYDMDGGFSFNSDGITVFAYGVTFRQNSTNAVLVTLNSGAQPDQSGSKSRIYWFGGYFINTTAYGANTNTGILVQDVKIGAIRDVRGTGHGASFIENSAETAFEISGISAFSNNYHVYMPDFFTNKSNPQNITYDQCAFSVHGSAGLNIECTINQLIVKNSSFTGDNSIVASTGITPSIPSLNFNIDSCDFEQGSTGSYITVANTNSVELQKMSITNSGFGGTTVKAAVLENINTLTFEGNRCVVSYTDGWLDLDSDCSNIDIGANYFYGSGAIAYACDRDEIRMFPYTINLSMIGQGVLSDFNNTAYSTGTGTVDMSSELTPWNAMLPPIGYFVKVEARDSGSSSGTAAFAFYDSSGSLVTQRTVGVVLSSHPDSSRLTDSGYVLADQNGDINYSVTATGTGTLNVYGKVQQILY